MLPTILVPANQYAETLLQCGYTSADAADIIEGLKGSAKTVGPRSEYILDVLTYITGTSSQQDAVTVKYMG